MDKAFKERKLSVLKVAYEECRTLSSASAAAALLSKLGSCPLSPPAHAARIRDNEAMATAVRNRFPVFPFLIKILL